MKINISLPSEPIAAQLISRLQNIEPVVDDSSDFHEEDLKQNIVDEGGDPDTKKAWATLSSAYVAHKIAIGAFITILRRTDDMRKGITVIFKDGRSYRISVTGNAKRYFVYANDKRKFLGMSQQTKDRAKIRLSKHLKG
jgi:hypothetical protein